MSKIKVAVAAAAITVGLGFAPLPASASLNDCPSGAACLFANSDFVGLLGWRTRGGTQNISAPNDNQASSWANFGGSWAAWAHEPGLQGKCLNMTPGEAQDMAWIDNDRVSSWRVWGTCQ